MHTRIEFLPSLIQESLFKDNMLKMQTIRKMMQLMKNLLCGLFSCLLQVASCNIHEHRLAVATCCYECYKYVL